MLFVEYQSEVLQEYERKKAAGGLSHRMRHLSPARLREECEVVCNQKYDRKDDKALEGFFGQGGDKQVWLKAIGRCETDKFRPLLHFMNGKTQKPDPKIVEFLAWLIGFEPRPFDSEKRYNPYISDIQKKVLSNDGNKEEVLTEEPAQIEERKRPAPTVSEISLPNLKTRRVTIAAIMLAFLVIGIYWVWPKKSAAVVLTGHEACMYWAEDHYQQISCNQKLDGVLVIALDSEKINHFKKITQPDTITENSIKRVWYVKFNGNYEYYTSEGFHPIDQRLRLKPITDYIIRMHIHSGQ